MNNRESVFAPERYQGRRKVSIALVAGSLLVASACMDESEQMPVVTTLPGETPITSGTLSETTSTTLETAITTEAADETTEVSAEECSFRYVQPEEYFNPENAEQLTEDLALLEKLHTDDTTVELSDIGTATGIIRRSYQDPHYAEAFVTAKDATQEKEFITTDEFLEIETSPLDMCDNNHLEAADSRAQLQRTVSIAQTLSRRIGERISEQTSAAIRRAFDTFEESVRELIEEFEGTE